MKEQVKSILANKGQEPIYQAILNTVRDLKQAGYFRDEIKDTIRENFFGIDAKVDSFIIKEGF